MTTQGVLDMADWYTPASPCYGCIWNGKRWRNCRILRWTKDEQEVLFDGAAKSVILPRGPLQGSNLRVDYTGKGRCAEVIVVED